MGCQEVLAPVGGWAKQWEMSGGEDLCDPWEWLEVGVHRRDVFCCRAEAETRLSDQISRNRGRGEYLQLA